MPSLCCYFENTSGDTMGGTGLHCLDLESDLRGSDLPLGEGEPHLRSKVYGHNRVLWGNSLAECRKAEGYGGERRRGISSAKRHYELVSITRSTLVAVFLMIPVVIGDNHFFQGANVTFNVNTDINVNGTFNMINYNSKDGGEEIWNQIKEKTLKKVSDSNAKGKMSGSFSLNLDGEETKLDLDVDNDLMTTKKTIVKTTTLRPSTVIKNTLLYIAPVNKTTVPVKAAAISSMKPTVASKRVERNSKKSSEMTTEAPLKGLTVNSTRIQGDDGGFEARDGQETTEDGIVTIGVHCVKVVRSMMNLYPQEFRKCEEIFEISDSNRDLKFTEMLDILEAALLELCQSQPQFYLESTSNLTFQVGMLVISKDIGLIKNKTDEVIDYISELNAEVTAKNSMELVRKIVAITKERVNNAKSAMIALTTKSARTRRSLLTVIEEESDDDGFAGADMEEMERSLIKKTRDSKTKLRSMIIPIAKALKGPSLISYIIPTNSTEDEANLDAILTSGKRILVREYMTSKTAQIIRMRASDSEVHSHDVVNIMEAGRKMMKLTRCHQTVSYKKSMIEPCTVGIMIAQVIGTKLCHDSKICPLGQAINGKTGNCTVQECAHLGLAANWRGESYINNSGNYWRNDYKYDSQFRVGGDLVCTINNVDVTGSNKCDSPKIKKLGSYELISFILLRNKTQIIGSPVGYKIVPSLAGNFTSSVVCRPDDVCGDCLTGKKSCAGDDAYCRREGIACVLDSECLCSTTQLAESKSLVKYDKTGAVSESVDIDFYFRTWAPVEFETRNVEDVVKSKSSCSMESLCTTGKVITSSDCEIRSVKLTISSRTLWIHDSRGLKTIETAIPWDLVLDKNAYTVTVFFADPYQREKSVKSVCQPFRVCQSITCLYCKEYLRAVRCWGVGTIILLLIIVPSFVVTLLWFLGLLLLKVGVVKRTIRRIIRTVWYIMCPCNLLLLLLLRAFRKGVKASKNAHSKIADYHDTIYKEEMEGLVIQDQGSFKKRFEPPSYDRVREEGLERPRLKGKPNLPYHLRMFQLNVVMCVMIQLIQITDGCSDSKVYSFSSKDCKTDMGVVSCETTTETSLIVSGTEQEVCFIMKSDKGDLMASMVLHIEGVNLECVKSVQYYVWDPKASLYSHSNCPSRDYCYEGPSSSCQKFLNGENLCNEMWPDLIGKLKEKYCYSSPGCAGNGCIMCSEGCVFGVVTYENPDQVTYEVSKCSSWRYRVKARMYVRRGDLSVKTSLTLEDSITKEFDGIGVTLKSITTPPTMLINKCFLTKENRIAMADCQSTDAIQAGAIGEIRCGLHSDSLNPNKLCLVSRNLVKVSRDGWNLRLEENMINVSAAFARGLLPKPFGSYNVENVGSTIVASLPPNSVVQILLSFKKYQIEMKKETSACYALKATIKGCYSCSEGANLTIRLNEEKKMTGESIIASHLHCRTAGVSALFSVKKESTMISSMINTESENIDEVCEFQCGGYKQDLRVIAHLTEKIMFDPRNQDHMITSSSSGHVNDVVPWSLESLFSVWRIKLVLSVFLFLILTLIFLKIAFMIFRRKRESLKMV
uniref:Glycoprotein n=1 Tax=Pink bollworm virus 3 TaxID=2713148 RepID=A0A6G6C926_9VIRU|nr:glycoprotein [Pink bollworm virus 3]